MTNGDEPAAPSHEARLLPRTQGLAAELLGLVPASARLAGLVFMAQFPRSGEAVVDGEILHDDGGELRRMRLPALPEAARTLMDACSRHESGNRLTSIIIKIAADGETTTEFGIAPPLTAEAQRAQLERLFGSVAEGEARRTASEPWPTLRFVPQRERLGLFLDPMRGIDEGWDRMPRPSPPAKKRPPPPPPPKRVTEPAPKPAPMLFALDDLHRLEAERAAAPTSRPRTMVPVPAGAGEVLAVAEADGVLHAEARALRGEAVAELHRRRPELRLTPMAGRLTRALEPGLGELRFESWRGDVNRAVLEVDGIATFDELLVRVRPVLAALGGMGPVVCSLGTSHPGQVRVVELVPVATLRRYLVADSPYGTKVYPCWLLGGPAHVVASLEFTVCLEQGRPSLGYRVVIKLP